MRVTLIISPSTTCMFGKSSEVRRTFGRTAGPDFSRGKPLHFMDRRDLGRERERETPFLYQLGACWLDPMLFPLWSSTPSNFSRAILSFCCPYIFSSVLYRRTSRLERRPQRRRAEDNINNLRDRGENETNVISCNCSIALLDGASQTE